jgi:hypothetical protein
VSETNNIDVFGNLKDFLGGLTERQVAQELERLEQIRSTMPTPAQSAYIGTLFAPGSGVADVAGELPSFPTADVPLEDFLAGEPLPSLPANIEEGRYLDAFLQSLGAAGDALYATPAVGPLLGATVKGIAAIPPVAKGLTKPAAKGIEGLRQQKIQEDVQQFARDNSKNLYSDVERIDILEESAPNQTSYVSPTLEALIAKAPPDLKGEQISNWLKANTDKGVKPKELELLDLDSYIMQNPNATVRDVAEYGSQNKVQLVTRVQQAEDAPTVQFDVDIPDLDPISGETVWNFKAEDIRSSLRDGDANIKQELADHYLSTRTVDDKFRGGGLEFTYDDMLNEIKLGKETGSTDSLDDVIDEVAETSYQENPYRRIDMLDADGSFKTLEGEPFAFGNDEVGYALFLYGERLDTEIPYSQTEAEILLRNEYEEQVGAVGLLGEDPSRFGQQYKQYIDGNLPGGSDYREYVINWGNAPEGHNVTTHFPDEKQISSVLARERKLEDGTTSLHIDEMQSDLHTRGSKFGYATDETQKTLRKKVAAKEEQIQTELNQIKSIIGKSMESFEPPLNAAGTPYLIGSAIRFEDATPSGVKQIVQQNIDRFYDQIKNTRGRVRIMHLNDFLNFANKNGLLDTTTYDRVDGLRDILFRAGETEDKLLNLVPNYPFKDDWHNMTLKNMVLQAVEEGKDSVSVSTSYAMKDRYTDKYDSFYETLYDKKIPSAMKKLANKYGGKFEKGKLDIDDTFGMGTEKFLPQPETGADRRRKLVDSNILRITPEMKQKILEEGMPSFAYGGPVNKFIGPNDINVFSD